MSKAVRSTKRSGRDIKAVVGSYLRRRHYIDSTESFKISELVTKQSCEQMSIDAAVEKDSSSLNSILYRNNNADPQQAEEQLIKVWSWITGIKDTTVKYEMSAVLLPLFLHLYLDLLQYGKRITISPTIIEEFCAHHGNDKVNDLVLLLPRITSIRDVDRFPNLKLFRSCKCQIKMTISNLNTLMEFLDKHALMILLSVFQKWLQFDVNIDGTSVQEDDEDDSFFKTLMCSDYDATMDFSGVQATSTPIVPTVPVRDADMKSLQDAIRLVRDMPPFPTPILIYTLNNTENICSSSVSRTFKLLATGTLSSELKLWNLQETKLPPRKIKHIPLGCDTNHVLYQQQESRYCTLRGHTGPVYDTKFLHKAEVVLSVSQDTDMRAWNLNDYTCASVYKGHTYPVWSVTAGVLGMHIATGSQDRTVRLWNLDRLFPLRVFSGHTQDVNCVRFHPNGAYLASASHDKTVRMWDIASGKMVRVFVGHSGSVHTLAFSPYGNFFASAGDGGRVKIWDIAASKLIADLKGHTSRVVAVDWSNDASTVASISCDGVVLGWNVDKLHLQFKPPPGSSPHGLLSGYDKVVREWDSNFSELAVLEQPFRYTTGFSSALSIEFSPRNTCIAVGIK